MKGRLYDELAQATRSSRCLFTLRLQQLFSWRSSKSVLFLFSQYLLWSNRAWFGQLKAVTLARWLIPRQAHAVFILLRLRADPEPRHPDLLFQFTRHGGEFFMSSVIFNHLPLHSFLKTLNTTMLFKRICSTSYSFKSCILPVEVKVLHKFIT